MTRKKGIEKLLEMEVGHYVVTQLIEEVGIRPSFSRSGSSVGVEGEIETDLWVKAID